MMNKQETLQGKSGNNNQTKCRIIQLARWRDSRGLTLVELLAALIIFSMIIGIMFTVIQSGVLAFKRTEGETLLREEGDYIMSKIIYAFYRSGAKNVKLENDLASANQTITITGEGETIYKLETKVETTDGHEHLHIFITEPNVESGGEITQRINQEKYILNTKSLSKPDDPNSGKRIFELQSCQKQVDDTGEFVKVDEPCLGEEIAGGIIKVNLSWRKAVDSDERDVWYQMESSFGF